MAHARLAIAGPTGNLGYLDRVTPRTDRTMRFPLAAIALLTALTASAQGPACGFDALNTLLASPVRAAAFDAADRDVLRATTAQQRGSTYTVPVVFHIVHDNGPENVPDSILALALEQVGLRYQNAAPYADSTGHVVPVTFCLASVDPFGQPTTGITRLQHPQTLTSIAEWPLLKNLVRWDPLRYLNVWIVRTISDAGVDGYSSFPAELGMASDGVVIEAQYVVNNPLLGHEFGHYLGLYHTFQGYCQNLNCELNGDRVCDTPPDDSFWYTCLELRCATETQDTTGQSPFTGDVPELPNYMDYSGCPRSFSQGQADRMAGFLAVTRTALTASYGCGLQPYGPPPVASIAVDSSACTGTLTFTNTTPGTDFVQWDLGADGWDAVGASWTAHFDTTGTYTLLAAACGPLGTDTVLLTFHVRVAPTPQFPIVSGFGGLAVDPANDLWTACLGDSLILGGAPGMVQYLWSTGDTTASIGFPVTGPFHAYLTAVDSNGLAWTSCAFDTVNVHLAPPLSSTSGDTLHCGDGLIVEMPVPAYPVAYTWYRNGGVLIGYANLLYTTSWSLGTDHYVVRLTDNVGCAIWTNTVAVTTLPTVPPVITQVGNDLVLDHPVLNMNWYTAAGVPLFTMDVPDTLLDALPGCYYVAGYDCAPVFSDTVCVLSVGMQATADPHAGAAVPNPAHDRLTLAAADHHALVRVDLMATDGRVVLQHTPAVPAGRVPLDLAALPAGLYTAVCRTEAGVWMVRVVKE